MHTASTAQPISRSLLRGPGRCGVSPAQAFGRVTLRVPLRELIANIARDTTPGPGPALTATLLPWARASAIRCCCWGRCGAYWCCCRYCRRSGRRRCCRSHLIFYQGTLLAHREPCVQLHACEATRAASGPRPALPTTLLPSFCAIATALLRLSGSGGGGGHRRCQGDL